MTERAVLAITGADRVDFLQGLVTNDVAKAADAMIYTALLTPQGKFIADFFVIGEVDRLLVDVEATHAPKLAQRLTMYRLRADVQMTETDLIVSRGTGPAPANAYPDPRHPQMGWRSYGTADVSQPQDWDALRVAHLIPETGIELTDDSYILETGFERLNGVDFKKGCFVGQEIVARMKHKTTLKKGLSCVRVSGPVTPGTDITADEKTVGTVHTVAGDRALAFLRFDRVTDTMMAGDAPVTVL